MTNREFYKEQILDIVCKGNGFGLHKDTNELCSCEKMGTCNSCAFHGDWGCRERTEEWCNAEYIEPCKFEKDELVEVSNNGIEWYLRRFSHIEVDEYKNKLFRTYINGYTSKQTDHLVSWKYCQKYGTLGGLVKEEENNV